jgi:hypothetical protein
VGKTIINEAKHIKSHFESDLIFPGQGFVSHFHITLPKSIFLWQNSSSKTANKDARMIAYAPMHEQGINTPS